MGRLRKYQRDLNNNQVKIAQATYYLGKLPQEEKERQIKEIIEEQKKLYLESLQLQK